jgi:ABC-type multidrug transport system ATPase subunit
VLSRGQKQKLGLARALVHDPQVLLLDEPASGLDPAARVQLRVLLRRLAAEGRTILISSHILSELEEVIDDAVFLVAGAVVDAAPAQSAARGWRIRLTGADQARAGQERARADADRIAAALGIDPGALGLDRNAAIAGFESEDAAAAGLRRIVEAGLDVSEFSPAQSALEHTFLNLQRTEPNA